LGYEIEHNKIRPTLKRAQGIVNFETPKNKKALQRFLGLANYDRMFIKNISEIAKPLYCLLSKENPYLWNEEAQKAFIAVKQKWEENLELNVPDLEKDFVLEVDASDIGIGAVLPQENKPIAFISRCLNKAERNNSITEKETLAALWSMENLSHYLDCRNFN
jgi:hypothetical protein